MGAGGATSRQKALFEDYEGFVDKFRPKRTTDDCMTPREVMEVVNRYVARRWDLDPAMFVRPFWPGGDYEAFDYPDGCVVVDNPPFSILARIQAWYLARGIPFFLFAPAMTCLSSRSTCMAVCHIMCGIDVTYANGAKLPTAFVTSLPSEDVVESDPALHDALAPVIKKSASRGKKVVPKYEYPPEVVTAARCAWYAAHGTRFAVRKDEACRIGALDSQRAAGKAIFGGGLLVSERAAAERAAAERAAAERAAAERAAAERAAAGRAAAECAAAEQWRLSDRERAVVAALSHD